MPAPIDRSHRPVRVTRHASRRPEGTRPPGGPGRDGDRWALAGRLADRLGFAFLAHVFFPVSTAALAADRVPRDAGAAGQRLADEALASQRRWRHLVFGDRPAETAALKRADARRRILATTALASRFASLPRLMTRTPPPPIDWRFPPPTQPVPAPLGPPAWMPDGGGRVRLSRPVPRRERLEYWVELVDPAEDITGYARLTRPVGGRPRGTIVFATGIGMEEDRLVSADAAARRAVREGWAWLELVAEDHGLRCAAGRFSGEALMAGGPPGLARHLRREAREIAGLVAWVRRRWGGPVVVAGVSLGAYATTLGLTGGPDWPAAAMPDGALLVAHGDGAGRAALGGDLFRRLKLRDALADAGWTDALLGAWTDALRPAGPPGCRPQAIFSVTGAADQLIPPEDAAALLDRWGVPAENRLVVGWAGHLTVPTVALNHRWAWDRLAALAAASGTPAAD